MDERSRQFEELARHWKPPAELERGSSREVELSGGGKAAMVMACLLVVGALVGAYFISRKSDTQKRENQELATTGIETQAVVTRHYRTGDKEAQPRIAYEFRHDGRTYLGNSRAPRAIWSRISVGSEIQVRFVPSRPELNHPAEWAPERVPPAVVLVVAVGGMLPAGLLLYMMRSQMRLLSEGRAAPAIVVGHRRVKGGQRVKYEFALLGGGVGKGGGGNSRRPPAVGSTITVVYDRDNPKRNAPYPFDMVRVVR